MKVNTGLFKIDKSLGGGLPENTNILVSGMYGTGKTIIGLKFLMEGLKKNQRCCYISLSEGKDDLIRAAKNIKSLKAIEKHVGKNLAIEHIDMKETMTMRNFNKLIESYPKLDRLVIDSINKLSAFTESEQMYRIYLSDLLKNLKKISNCTILLCDTKGDNVDTGKDEASECDGVIRLSLSSDGKKTTRTLDVIKLRYVSFDPFSSVLRISNEDVIVKN